MKQFRIDKPMSVSILGIMKFTTILATFSIATHAQEISEPIDATEMLGTTSEQSNGRLADLSEKIGAMAEYDLLVVLVGEFPERSEIFGFRRLNESGSGTPRLKAGSSSGSWKVIYIPYDPARSREKKVIRFEGNIPTELVTNFGKLAWKLVSKQTAGIQSANFHKENPGHGPFTDCYAFSRNDWPGSSGGTNHLIGGHILRPDQGTRSYQFFEMAVAIRNKLHEVTDATYNWRGNLDMANQSYDLPKDIVLKDIVFRLHDEEHETNTRRGRE